MQLLRSDGVYSYYSVEHRNSEYRSNEWCRSNYGHMLFRGLTFDEKQGALGDLYRELIKPTHRFWQTPVGLHEFPSFDDARRMMATLARHEHRPEGEEYRIVRVTVAQLTEEA